MNYPNLTVQQAVILRKKLDDVIFKLPKKQVLPIFNKDQKIITIAVKDIDIDKQHFDIVKVEVDLKYLKAVWFDVDEAMI